MFCELDDTSSHTRKIFLWLYMTLREVRVQRKTVHIKKNNRWLSPYRTLRYQDQWHPWLHPQQTATNPRGTQRQEVGRGWTTTLVLAQNRMTCLGYDGWAKHRLLEILWILWGGTPRLISSSISAKSSELIVTRGLLSRPCIESKGGNKERKKK